MSWQELRLTPIQRKMLEVLSDKKSHRPQELHACLNDDLGPLSNIGAHLTIIRKKLISAEMDIICETGTSDTTYRLSRLVRSEKYLPMSSHLKS